MENSDSVCIRFVFVFFAYCLKDIPSYEFFSQAKLQLLIKKPNRVSRKNSRHTVTNLIIMCCSFRPEILEHCNYKLLRAELVCDLSAERKTSSSSNILVMTKRGRPSNILHLPRDAPRLDVNQPFLPFQQKKKWSWSNISFSIPNYISDKWFMRS